MKLEVIKKFDDLIVLMRQDPEDDYYEYYLSNPWYTVIHHYIGVKEKIDLKEITGYYDIGAFDYFINKYCF